MLPQFALAGLGNGIGLNIGVTENGSYGDPGFGDDSELEFSSGGAVSVSGINFGTMTFGVTTNPYTGAPYSGIPTEWVADSSGSKVVASQSSVPLMRTDALMEIYGVRLTIDKQDVFDGRIEFYESGTKTLEKGISNVDTQGSKATPDANGVITFKNDSAIFAGKYNNPEIQLNIWTPELHLYKFELLDVGGNTITTIDFRDSVTAESYPLTRGNEHGIDMQFSSFDWSKMTDASPGALFRITYNVDDVNLKAISDSGYNYVSSLKPIKDIYKTYFDIGNIINISDFDDDIRMELLQRHFDIMTAENAMKPSAVSKDKDKYEFSAADDILVKASNKGWKMHGHALAWHQQSAAWLNTGDAANYQTAKANLESFVAKVAGQFKGRVVSWDVLNEAMNDNPSNATNWKGALRKADWYNAYANGGNGWDYVYDLFVAAREADPNAKLYYNDYNLDNDNKATAVAAMVVDINNQYAKNTGDTRKLIEGVGMQGHYNLSTNPLAVENSIKKFIAAGVDIIITELDITAGTNNQISKEQEERQAILYAKLMVIFKAYYKNIDRVTFWGVDDGTSWRSTQSPLLFKEDLSPKAAFYAVVEPEKYLEANGDKYEPLAQRSGSALYSAPTWVTSDGKIDTAWSKAEALPIDRDVWAWSGAKGTSKVLWDENNLYVLVSVKDKALDNSADEAHEKDSVEIFVDESNSKAFVYNSGMGQYRVGFDGKASFGPTTNTKGFESKAVTVADGYIIQMKIPFKTLTPKNKGKIGFDAQINDANGGKREAVTVWSDMSGKSYESGSDWGTLTLSGASTSGNGDNGNSGNNGNNNNSSSDSDNSSGGGSPTTPSDVKTTPTSTATVNNQTASVVVEISAANLEKAVTENSGTKDTKTLNLVMDVPPTADGVANLSMTISADTLEHIKDLDIDTVAITLGNVQIVLPIELIESISGKSDTIKLEAKLLEDNKLSQQVSNLAESGQAYELNLYVNNKKHDGKFGKLVDVTLPYTLKSGQKSDYLAAYYLNSAGRLEPRSGVYNRTTGKLTFNTISFSTYIVKDHDVTFDDLNKAEWARTYIETMASKSIISGRNSTTFDPNTNITRAEFATLLVRMLGGLDSTAKSTYKDVSKDNIYYTAIASLESLGIKIAEKTPKSFSPNDTITREEMFDLMGQVLVMKGYRLSNTTILNKFKDSGDVSGYAYENVALLVENKIIAGMGDGTLKPKNNLTRAEASTVLYMLLNK